MIQFADMIVAHDKEGFIGKDNALPWKIPSELQRFKDITMGHALIVGRKTWESIGRPLPGRTMIVVTRQDDYEVPEAVHTVPNLVAAFARALELGLPIMVIGGQTIYEQAIPYVNRIWGTEVQTRVSGADAHFPQLDGEEWIMDEPVHYPEEGEAPAYLCYTLNRRNGNRALGLSDDGEVLQLKGVYPLRVGDLEQAGDDVAVTIEFTNPHSDRG